MRAAEVLRRLAEVEARLEKDEADFDKVVQQEVAKQVKPLMATLGQVDELARKQRGASDASRGQFESVYKTMGTMQESLDALTASVESACQDANAAKVDSSALLAMVADVQTQLAAQRSAVRTVLESLQ